MQLAFRHTFALTALFALPLLQTTTVSAQIARYNAPNGSFNATQTAANVSASALNTNGSTAILQPGTKITNVVQVIDSITSTNVAAAVANNQYFQFTITPQSGYLLNLTSLVFDAARDNPGTPRGYALRSSRDNFASNIGSSNINTNQPDFNQYSIDLSRNAFQNLSSALTLRLYQFSPSTTQGIYYDNITLNGTVTATAIPEPAFYAMSSLFMLGGGGLFLRRRKARPCA